MEYASVTVQLGMEDVVAFSRFVAKERGRKWEIEYFRGWAIGAFVASFLLFIPLWVMIHRDGLSIGELARLVFLDARQAASGHGFILGIVGIGFWALLLKRFVAHRRLGSKTYWQGRYPSLLLSNLYRVLDEGLYVENVRAQLLARWTAIVRVAENANYFYVMQTQVRGWIIPKRCFSTPEAAAHFADQVRLQVRKHAESFTRSA